MVDYVIKAKRLAKKMAKDKAIKIQKNREWLRLAIKASERAVNELFEACSQFSGLPLMDGGTLRVTRSMSMCYIYFDIRHSSSENIEHDDHDDTLFDISVDGDHESGITTAVLTSTPFWKHTEFTNIDKLLNKIVKLLSPVIDIAD